MDFLEMVRYSLETATDSLQMASIYSMETGRDPVDTARDSLEIARDALETLWRVIDALSRQ